MLKKRCDKESRCCSSLRIIGDGWHQFYAVLDCEKLTLYQSKDDSKQFLATVVVLLSDIHSLVKYKSKDVEYGIQVTASGRIFHFSCDSEENQVEWIDTIQNGIVNEKGAAKQDEIMVGFPLEDVKELRVLNNRQFGHTIFIKAQNGNEVTLLVLVFLCNIWQLMFSNLNPSQSSEFVKMLEMEWNMTRSNVDLLVTPLSPSIPDMKPTKTQKEEIELKNLPSAGLSDKLKFQEKFQLEGEELLDGKKNTFTA
jgi:hypothetical protein